MTHHPDDRLRAFALGELGDHLAALVAEHLDECPRCANVALRHDPLARVFASVDDLSPPADLAERILAAATPAESGAASRPEVDGAAAWAGVALLAAASVMGAANAAWHPGALIAAARAVAGVGQVLLHAAADPRIAPALAASVALVGTSALLTARTPDLRRTA